MTYVVVAGNPIEGVEFHGPFDTVDDANCWAEREFRHGGEWWVAELNPPEE